MTVKHFKGSVDDTFNFVLTTVENYKKPNDKIVIDRFFYEISIITYS